MKKRFYVASATRGLWYPLLQILVSRPPHKSLKEYEQSWSEEPKLRAELECLRQELEQYANTVAVIAGLKEIRENLKYGYISI